ncbi:N-substituted formamide deformylase precursor [compost metagenome]
MVKEINPWINIETAITRKAADGFVIGENQKITLEQALRAYTVGSAVADNLNDVKGSLSVGKYADFIVLNQNPFALEDVSVVKTIETWINGKLNYKK